MRLKRTILNRKHNIELSVKELEGYLYHSHNVIFGLKTVMNKFNTTK